MKSNTLDRTQTQYERKLARQKQLDMMEAAAAGQSYDGSGSGSCDSSIASRSTMNTHAPEGAIESARRFLWDEDEDAMIHTSNSGTGTGASHKLRAASAFDMYGDSQGVVGLMSTTKGGATTAPSSFGFGSRMANTIKGAFTRSRYDYDDEDQVVNIAPRRPSSFLKSDAHAREADEYIDNRKTGAGGRRRPGFITAIGDCCLAVFHTLVGAFAVLCEYLTAALANINPKLCLLLMAIMAGLGLLIFGIVAIVARSNGSSSSSSATTTTSTTTPPPDIQDETRYEVLRSVILESKFTSDTTLDLPGTAQNYALRWLTDEDPAKLSDDDDALLQRYALATFYFSTYVYAEIVDAENADTSAGGWTYGDYWMSEKGICMWFGISCTPHLKEGVEEVHYNENSDVLRFNLTDNNIRGVIPSELSALENLVSLDLGNNHLQGTIPKAISTMKELRELYLEYNFLTGTIHTEFGMIKTLRDFFIGTNQFSGTIPNEIGQLTNLRALGLDENLLTGKIPELWTCTKLLILYLDSNQLTGTISPNIQALTELIDLRLRKNNLTGTIPNEIHTMTHMELFYVDDNKLGGTIPAIWDLMTRLQEIQLYKNAFTGVLPDSISALRDLKIFYADNNKLKGTIPTSYGTLGDLQTFYVFNNEISGTLPTEFGNMKNLIDLQIYNNKLMGQIPSEIGNCYKLQKFEAQDNTFSGQVPPELGSIENLQMLKLYRNQLVGTLPTKICDARDNFELGFIGADCNIDDGGTLTCDCCTACYP